MNSNRIEESRFLFSHRVEMDNKNGLQDVSSFLLVEGSADSEADYGLLKLCHDVNIACDDDDAASCSCDTSDTHEVIDRDVQDCSDFSVVEKNIQSEPCWSRCEMWLRDAALEYMSIKECEEESKFGINLSREAMDQMDDRLFWETCMAIGYP